MSRAPVKDFGKPPPNYVAGLGRGAVGFTTRSDIGPARAVVTREDRYVAGRGGPSIAPETDLNESNFDDFSGYGGSLFDSSTPYDAEDLEADRIYDSVDARMAQRNHNRRKLVAERKKQENAKRKKLQTQFADVKRQLGSLSDTEWMAIPEAGDLSRRNKRVNVRADQFTPVPDSITSSALASARSTTSIDPNSGITTPAITDDITSFGQARTQVLGFTLDKASDSVMGQTNVDPKGMMTDINSLKIASNAELSDIHRARVLLRSVITTNPSHPPGWISIARLEETAGKLSAARKVIMQGTEAVSSSEDVWLEAARLHPPTAARAILAKAVRVLPNSVKVWMHAATLEDTEAERKAVLRRALEFIPGSVRIWKAAVELETPDDARILLSRAVECVPHSTKLWLALARLETYEQARKVLNRARKAVPTEPSIWISAAQLEEANGSHERIDAIITRAVNSLVNQKVVIDREQWLREAEASERAGSPLTCQAIVRATISSGVEMQDRKATWLVDAKAKAKAGSIETARAVFSQLLSVFASKRGLWWEAAVFEKAHGTHESLISVLRRAVEHCPNAEVLWLMSAKELWLAGDVDTARTVLTRAFAANPDSEEIWLASVKMESEVGENARARLQLQRARERARTARVWMKSAEFERRLGERDAEGDMLEQAIREFPTFWKLHCMLAQNRIALHRYDDARAAYRGGLQHCPESVELWLGSARLDAEHVSLAKARATLESARKRLTLSDHLWLEAVRVEERAGAQRALVENVSRVSSLTAAVKLMARALQECPASGRLWAHAIEMEPRPKRKAKSYDALKKCTDDAHVFVAVARLFWADRKVRKARNWFERAVTADPDHGDAWAYYYRFASEYTQQDTVAHPDVIEHRCADADPRHGDVWCQVRKAVGNEALKGSAVLCAVSNHIGTLVDPFAGV